MPYHSYERCGMSVTRQLGSITEARASVLQKENEDTVRAIARFYVMLLDAHIANTAWLRDLGCQAKSPLCMSVCEIMEPPARNIL